MGLEKCRTCGRMYEEEGTGSEDGFCSELCREVGCYVSGGGDRRKPNVAEEEERKPVKAARKDYDLSKYPRVQEMLKLPATERWKVSKSFTEDERGCALALAKRSLAEDELIEVMAAESARGGEESEAEGAEGLEEVGESDDGSV